MQFLADGRFSLSRALGTGGVTLVYEAFDHQEGQWVALQLLHPELVARPALRARIEHDVRARAGIVHPNLVRTLQVGGTEDQSWVVLELCRGGSLEEWLEARERMPPRLAVLAMIAICRALEVAHAAGALHLDVRPASVLVSDTGAPKLGGFGFARVPALEGPRVAEAVMPWTAPERREGGGAAVAADVYGVGATLFTLVTGRAEPELYQGFSEPRRLVGLPPALLPIVLGCTARDAGARYASMADLRMALEHAEVMTPPLPVGTPGLLLRALPPLPPPPALGVGASSAPPTIGMPPPPGTTGSDELDDPPTEVPARTPRPASPRAAVAVRDASEPSLRIAPPMLPEIAPPMLPEPPPEPPPEIAPPMLAEPALESTPEIAPPMLPEPPPEIAPPMLIDPSPRERSSTPPGPAPRVPSRGWTPTPTPVEPRAWSAAPPESLHLPKATPAPASTPPPPRGTTPGPAGRVAGPPLPPALQYGYLRTAEPAASRVDTPPMPTQRVAAPTAGVGGTLFALWEFGAELGMHLLGLISALPAAMWAVLAVVLVLLGVAIAVHTADDAAPVDVPGAQAAFLAEYAALDAAIDAERDLLDDLAAVGVSPEPLREALRRYERTASPEQRAGVARALVADLRQALTSAEVGGEVSPEQVRSLRRRIQDLDARSTAAVRAAERLAAARASAAE